MYHDDVFSHNFRNKIIKIKIERLIYFFSKFNRQGTAALSFIEKFEKIAVENQIVFAENYDDAQKKQSIHEQFIAKHVIKIKQKKISNSTEKMNE